jgi:nitrate reductase cytochrome c-type subunit
MVEKEEKEMVSKEVASRQVLSMVNRLALLHHAFTKTLIAELGEKKGKEVILKAIRLYGEKVGKSVREKTLAKGLKLLRENYQEDLPLFGWSIQGVEVEGEPRARVLECHLAKAWKDLGAPELGRLYCYMDQAKYEAYNPELECVHVKNVLDGDAYCELAVRVKKK